MRIIGLTGLACAGKDTTARLAIEWCAATGLGARRLAFADPLKLSAAAALGFQPADPESPVSEALDFCDRLKTAGVVHVGLPADGTHEQPWGKNLSGREFLQLYGTEAHRDVFGYDFWVDVTLRKIDALSARGELGAEVDVVFITDARFPNEAEAIRARPGGEVWQVVRDAAGLSDGLEAHASEAGLPPESVDLIIPNNGTVDELGETVRGRCEERI